MSLKRNSIVIILALIVMFMYFLNNYASEQQFESLPKRNAKSFFKYKPQFQEIQNKVNKIESHFYNESITIEKYSKADEEKVLKFYKNILTKENRYTSQNKEDGVIIAILNFLKFNKPGYYVEFGTETGIQINTRHLREVYKWKGLLMDGSNANPRINLHREKITHNNILELFNKYQVSKELDLFSEDTDYADYWITEKVLTEYTPKIVIHEINQQTPDKCVTVPKPNSLVFWDGSNYHGGSVCAFRCLAIKFGYTMVYCESAGVNCFWIRNDLLKKNLGVDVKVVQQILSPKFLWKKPMFVYRNTDKVWEQTDRCGF